jgi:hypothetical protein
VSLLATPDLNANNNPQSARATNQAWFGFAGMVFAISAAMLALLGKWLHNGALPARPLFYCYSRSFGE